MNGIRHFEIPGDDTNRARKFYETIFGWQTSEFPMPGGSTYIGLNTGPVDEQNMWKEPGFINGGMFKRGSDYPGKGPTITAVVEDIDQAIAKVKDAGGKIASEKKEIPGMGVYAYIYDTEENLIGIWQDLQ